MAWTDERIVTLRRMWADNKSCSQIAAALDCGISRNAVIGKIHRLGLSGRIKISAAPIVRNSKFERPKPSRMPRAKPAGNYGPSEPMMPKLPAVALPPEVPLLDLSRRIRFADLKFSSCRWPLGDPLEFETFRYCGADRCGEGPYCGFHANLAYVPPASRRERDKRTLGGIIGAIQKTPYQRGRRRDPVTG